MVELVTRLVFSLAIVVGLLILLSRLAGRRFGGGSRSLVTVLHRQPLSRSTAVAVVTVGSRVLVLGTTEHQVSLLAELSPQDTLPPAVETDLAPLSTSPDLDAAFARDLQDALSSTSTPSPAPRAGSGRLGQSLLAPQTWRDTFAAATGRAR
ncbi:flagellar biosynthetic protein FliO [Dermatophilaceae bacterium Soc4.6]